jgi:hypothetical protein
MLGASYGNAAGQNLCQVFRCARFRRCAEVLGFAMALSIIGITCKDDALAAIRKREILTSSLDLASEARALCASQHATGAQVEARTTIAQPSLGLMGASTPSEQVSNSAIELADHV